jgi:hypothetical protein
VVVVKFVKVVKSQDKQNMNHSLIQRKTHPIRGSRWDSVTSTSGKAVTFTQKRVAVESADSNWKCESWYPSSEPCETFLGFVSGEILVMDMRKKFICQADA